MINKNERVRNSPKKYVFNYVSVLDMKLDIGI